MAESQSVSDATSKKGRQDGSSRSYDADVHDDKNDEDHEDRDDVSMFQFAGISGDGTTSQLCSHCQYVLDNWFMLEQNPDFQYPHYEYTFQLEESALSGCGLCHQFWYRNKSRTVNKTGKPNGIKNGFYTRLPAFEGDSRRLSLEVDMLTKAQYFDENLEARVARKRDFHTFIIDVIPAQYSALHVRASQSVQDSTRSSMILASRWLERCQKTHWKCNNCIGSSMPTRLIFTGRPFLRMCLSKDIPVTSQYATLSHCWGQYNSTNLTKDNFLSFQERIPPEAVSKTIQDAIEIAYNLGFSYLWIDKLCIVQDDPQDWEHEASLMATVYGSSSLNIAATGASDGNLGCFFERKQHWKCQAEVKIGEASRLYDFIPSGFVDFYLTNLPLLERGWALQERLLPARTLHFTPTEIFWECHHKSACETFPEEIPPECKRNTKFFDKKPLDLTVWAWAVERYSKCKLTYPKDKLVAISGVARYIQNQTKDQYIAGMWRDNLPVQLCWLANAPFRKLDSHSDIAPTWSWASSNDSGIRSQDSRQVNPLHRRLDWIFRVTVLDVSLQNRDTDPFGPISKATLHLRCDILLNIQLIPGLDDEYFVLTGGKRVPISIFWDILEFAETHTIDQEKQVYLLPIFQHKPHFHTITIGIVLHIAYQQKGVYQRIGYFCLFFEESATLLGPGSKAHELPIDPEDCWKVRQDRFGKTCHIIKLI